MGREVKDCQAVGVRSIDHLVIKANKSLDIRDTSIFPFVIFPFPSSGQECLRVRLAKIQEATLAITLYVENAAVSHLTSSAIPMRSVMIVHHMQGLL